MAKMNDDAPVNDTDDYLGEWLIEWIDRALSNLAVMLVRTSDLVDSTPARESLAAFLSYVDRSCPIELKMEMQSRWPSNWSYTVADFRSAMELCRMRLDEMRTQSQIEQFAAPASPPEPAPADYVCLSEIALLLNLSKSTLEKHKKAGVLPPPDVESVPGAANLWDYRSLRKVLTENYRRNLPVTFPDRCRKKKP